MSVGESAAELTAKYDALNKKLTSLRSDFVKPLSSIENFKETHDESIGLRKDIRTSSLVVKDAEFVCNSALLVNERARNTLKISDQGQRDMNMYLGGIKLFVNRDASSSGDSGDVAAPNMAALGEKVYRMMLRAPASDFMIGPIDINRKIIVRQPRARLVIDDTARTQASVVTKETHETSEDSLNYMREIYDILVEIGSKVDLHSFITNPKSFSQTVENMFFVSFLVRDGKVALTFDDINGIKCPQIEAIVQSDAREPKRMRQEVVINISMDNWSKIIEMWDITESVIPHREEPDGLILRLVAGDRVADEVTDAVQNALN